MLAVLVLTFPLLLLALPLLMERIERPLRSEATIDEVTRRMPRGAPDELERLVSEGYAPAVESYWRRQRIAAMLALRPERD